MAEAVLSVAVETLSYVLIHEAAFLQGVQHEVERLHTELRRMKCFLKDADTKKQDGDERVRNWVAEVRDLAYDAEDVIGTFIYKVAFKQRGGGIRDFLKNYACIFSKGVDLHMIGIEIQALFTRIQDISSSRITYGIRNVGEGEALSSSTANQRMQQLRRSYPYEKDEDIIGLEEQAEELVAELIKADDERRCVVSIFGVGGLGKTTLAKKVYNHATVKSTFDCCAWAFVSETCTRRVVLHEILKTTISSSDREMLGKMEEDMVEKLYKFLQEKRYLIVLDDIWNVKDWDILVRAFPNGKPGSKILLTTRNKGVASRADPWSLHLEPRHLNNDECWELFCKKAFHSNTERTRAIKSPPLEKLGREMVRKCGGLPLAITVLGGLLWTKKSVEEWEIVSKNINTHLNKHENGVSRILSLSYNDLPYHLKPCFQYLGLFPEDFEVSTRQLINLWIAEGFVGEENEGEETKERVGEQQLIELINRCVVQVGKTSRRGRIKTCRLHDLVRNMCLIKSREDSFLHLGNMPSSSSANKCRRYAIHSGDQLYSSFQQATPHLRAFIAVFRNRTLGGLLPFELVKISFQKYRLLRVLALNDIHIVGNKSLPEEIGRLVHLRYLGLGGSIQLPSSIGNLRNLQTLVLVGISLLKLLPHTIGKMEQLRYLHIRNSTPIDPLLRLGNLRNLQTLHCIRAGNWIERKGLVNLNNLQKLQICGLSRSQVEIILDTIVAASNCLLRSLELHLEYQEEAFPDLEPLSRCYQLCKLQLVGLMENNLPQFPSNVTKLNLSCSRVEQDPMETLQNLPNLVSLHLCRAYVGKEMVCAVEGFPQLQVLRLEEMHQIEEWKVEEGGMPFLRKLSIRDCQLLKMLPEGLKFMTALTELEMIAMGDVFDDRVKIGGKDWYKIQHIPSITHTPSPRG